MSDFLVTNELDVLAGLVPLQDAALVEIGCGAARLARQLLERCPGATVVGVEPDARQHARNLAAPHTRLHCLHAPAEALPLQDAQFDGALMLKSLHHVPQAAMAQAFSEVARVLRPGGWLYVSEPVYAGALNELLRLFNDEGAVRAAAQDAIDAAIRSGAWVQVAEPRFDMPVHFADYAEFEARMMRPSWADYGIDDALRQRVAAAFAPHQGPDGASFTRPMHVRLLRKA